MTRRVLNKEDRQAEYYGVRSHWNLFNYVECSKCEERYVRESGWVFYREGWPGFYNHRTYVCGQCCTTIRGAATWAKEFEQGERNRRRMPTVKPPAPPPMRQTRDS